MYLPLPPSSEPSSSPPSLPCPISASSLAKLRSLTNLEFSSSPHPHFYLPIPLPAPSPSLLLHLTAPFPSDAPSQTEALNSPLVAPFVRSPPYPFALSDAHNYNSRRTDLSNTAIRTWLEEEALGQVEGCPVNCVRDAETGAWMGDLGCWKWGFDDFEFRGEGERKGAEWKELKEQNSKRKSGDPELIWSFGFYLHPRYHNQGLATSCLQALIHSYMVPVLHATRIRATVLVGNMGSRRAQEKNGFREIGRFWTEIGENRGGGTKECWVMEWRADCEEA